MSDVLTTKAQRDILRYALFGASPGMRPHRNYYLVSEGYWDEADVTKLIGLGLMRKGAMVDGVGHYHAHVTKAGAAEIDEVLPVEPNQEPTP